MARQTLPEKGCSRSPFSLIQESCWGLIFYGLLVTTYYFYSWGFLGPFLFDDFINLAALGNQGQVDSWEKVGLYLQSGFAGPTGRPVSLLTFLLDDYSWPSNPESFKKTNTYFHLLAGSLLFWLFIRINRLLKLDAKLGISIALLATAIWILHSLNVSTVLYVVQRMTILSMLFATASLLAYVVARENWCNGRYCIAFPMLALCGFLFVLSVYAKENTVIFPVLVTLIEFYLLPAPNATWRRWVRPILITGSVCIVGYLVYLLVIGLGAPWIHREFSLIERLLTESRIIWSYIWLVILPKSSTAGLYNDGILISRGLFEPYTTFLSLVALVALVGLSLKLYRRIRYLAVAIWLFLVAHLIESTVIPLELYFEHRNYFPLIFIAFAMSYYIHRIKKYRIAISGLVVVVLLLQLGLRTSLWSDGNLLKLTWAQNAPLSERARLQSARIWLENGNYYEAKSDIEQVIALYPARPNAYIMQIVLDCTSSLTVDSKTSGFYRAAETALENYRWDPTTEKYLEFLFVYKKHTNCPVLSWNQYQTLVKSFLANPGSAKGSFRARVLRLLANSELAKGNGLAALEYYSEAYKSFNKIDAAMLYVSELAQAGFLAQARSLLATIKNDYLNQRIVASPLVDLDDINYLEEQLNR